MSEGLKFGTSAAASNTAMATADFVVAPDLATGTCFFDHTPLPDVPHKTFEFASECKKGADAEITELTNFPATCGVEPNKLMQRFRLGGDGYCGTSGSKLSMHTTCVW